MIYEKRDEDCRLLRRPEQYSSESVRPCRRTGKAAGQASAPPNMLFIRWEAKRPRNPSRPASCMTRVLFYPTVEREPRLTNEKPQLEQGQDCRAKVPSPPEKVSGSLLYPLLLRFLFCPGWFQPPPHLTPCHEKPASPFHRGPRGAQGMPLY